MTHETPSSDEKIFGVSFETARSIGNRLREAREKKGRTYKQISAKTKIRESYLEDIELGKWELLPKGANGRGFIRLYARELSVSLTEFDEFVQVQEQTPYQMIAEECKKSVIVQDKSEIKTAAKEKAKTREAKKEKVIPVVDPLAVPPAQTHLASKESVQSPTPVESRSVEPRTENKVEKKNAPNSKNKTKLNPRKIIFVSLIASFLGGTFVFFKDENILDFFSKKIESDQSFSSSQDAPDPQDDLTPQNNLASQNAPIDPNAQGNPALQNDPNAQQGNPTPQNEPTPQQGNPTPQNEPAAQQGNPALQNEPAAQQGNPALQNEPAAQQGNPALQNAPAPQQGNPALQNAPAPQQENPAPQNAPAAQHTPAPQMNTPAQSIPPAPEPKAEPIQPLQKGAPTTSPNQGEKASSALEKTAKLDILAPVDIKIMADGKNIFSGNHKTGNFDLVFKHNAEISVSDGSKVKLNYGNWDHGVLGTPGRNRKIILNATSFLE